MKTARLAVLGVALAAGTGAAVLANRSKPPEIVAAPPALSDGVLVAARELNFGVVVEESDMRWEDWPIDHIPEGLVRKSASPGGVEELQGSLVRSNFARGRAFAAGAFGQGSAFRLSRCGSRKRLPRGGD